MCINFNGYHSGGSSFLIVNDCWLLQNYLYTTDISSALKKKKKKSPSIWFRTPKPVRIRQSGRTGIGGVTKSMFKIKIRRIEEVNGSSNGAPLAPRCSILGPDFRRHRCNLTFQVLATQRNCSFLTITIPPSFQIGNTDSPFLLKKEKA